MPEPYLLESNDGLLHFAMLPAGYSLAKDGELYSYSGLYRAGEKTPLWTIDWYSFDVHLSDSGQ
jgi:hypothetical protein